MATYEAPPAVLPDFSPGHIGASHHRHSHSLPESHAQRLPHATPSLSQYVEPSPPYAAVAGSYTVDRFDTPPPTKRQRLSLSGPVPSGQVARRAIGASGPPSVPKPPANTGDGLLGNSSVDGPRANPETTVSPSPPALNVTTTATTKSKRVRTGCLTCRERHLKCDEGVPDCLNCRKSNRECKRGIRLNFIDIQVKEPPYMLPAVEWSVQFQDESRLIASEYQGGLGRYAAPGQTDGTPPREPDADNTPGQRQRPSDSTDTFDFSALFASSNKDFPPSGVDGVFYSSDARLGPINYGSMASSQHKQAESPVPAPQQVQMTHPSTTNPGGFTLATIREQFHTGGDGSRRTHAYKNSDVSSISSSLALQNTNGPFQSVSTNQPPPTNDGLMTPPSEAAFSDHSYLSTDEEIHYMQVFVNEVAVWMDSFDKDKHFSRVVPYLALKSPMLLNAFLACGVKHLTLVDKSYNEDKALFYYDTATTQLLRNLQNPDRNTAECATTAVVLNVYEIMSEKPTQRMSHIAGARALIRECGWNAKSPGVGAACFWLNIGMEVLSCLAFDWQTAWDPNQWGIDADFNNWGNGGGDEASPYKTADCDPTCGIHGMSGGGQEEVWVHRIFYILARIANFRANIPRFQEPSPHDEMARKRSRFAEWTHLKAMCDRWNSSCPRAMRPFGFVNKPSSQSLFPRIWLIKRAAVIGSLFYHTAMCLLAQINPLDSRDSEENRATQLRHAHQVCGIVAHTKDRGVASVAIRSLAIASSVLTNLDEQKEVLEILDRINKETGWGLGKVLAELKKAWGWESSGPTMLAAVGPGAGAGSQSVPSASSSGLGQQPFTLSPPVPQQQNRQQIQQQQSMPSSAAGGSQGPARRTAVNPLLSQADFSLPNHPYQKWYEPPNRSNAYNSQHFWMT